MNWSLETREESASMKEQWVRAVREWGILEVLKRTLGVPLQGPPTQVKSTNPKNRLLYGAPDLLVFWSSCFNRKITKFQLKSSFFTEETIFNCETFF